MHYGYNARKYGWETRRNFFFFGKITLMHQQHKNLWSLFLIIDLLLLLLLFCTNYKISNLSRVVGRAVEVLRYLVSDITQEF